MGRLQTCVVDCEYNEYDRSLTEPFIHGLDTYGMIGEILREITGIRKCGLYYQSMCINMDPKGGDSESTERVTEQYNRGQRI